MLFLFQLECLKAAETELMTVLFMLWLHLVSLLQESSLWEIKASFILVIHLFFLKCAMDIWLLVKCKDFHWLLKIIYWLGKVFCLTFTKHFYCLLLCDNLGSLSQNSWWFLVDDCELMSAFISMQFLFWVYEFLFLLFQITIISIPQKINYFSSKNITSVLKKCSEIKRATFSKV